MVRFKYLSAALLAAMLAGCAGSDDGLSGQSPSQPSGSGDGRTAVGFQAYLSRSTTRAGAGGILTPDNADAGNVSLQAEGFGVFAYYTDLKKYDQTYLPNFMYNTHVTYAAGNWGYSPLMYWPNEYGSNAQSDDEDKVSFFAYAPYAAHASAAAGSVAGDATVGITGFSRNSTVGDPIVKYIASFDPSKSVDLCWGVVGSSETSWNRIQGTAQTLAEGKPWLDVEHPQGVTDQKLKFTFRHALSQLNVQIDADVDATSHSDGGTSLDANTRIYVRSISFTGIALQGALNLNNQKAGEALWLDYSGTTDLPYGQSVTVKDGLRDGREGAASATADNEIPKGLNPGIIQNNGFTGGVTTSLQNAFGDGSSAETPVCVIPTGESMTVTIVYDVETLNPDLPGYISDGVQHGVSVENKITKAVDFSGGGLQCGKKYTLKLHLGMNSVKFDASVDPWQDGAEAQGWLPANTAVSLTLGSGRTMSLTGGSQTLTASTTASTVTWTTSDDTVVDISESNPSPTRGRRGGTRAVKTISDTSVKQIWLIPKAVGTATITCTSEQGSASVVITVVADAKPKATPATVAAATGLKYGDTGALVNVTGSAANGTMHYAVTTTSSAPEAGEYSTAVPTASGKNAGTYYVWSKAVADNSETHDDSDVTSVSVTIAKAAGTITFATASYSKEIGETGFTQTVTNTGDGTVNYASNNTSVASVNNSGEVTIGSTAGTATITATVTDGTNYTYAEKTATYTVTVTNPGSPQVNVNTIGGWGSGGNVDGLNPDTGL